MREKLPMIVILVVLSIVIVFFVFLGVKSDKAAIIKTAQPVVTPTKVVVIIKPENPIDPRIGVTSIKHPVTSDETPKPLVVEYQTLNGIQIEKRRIECYPMVFKQYIYQNGKPTVNDKNNRANYYDACELPDKKGFILYGKPVTATGETELNQLELWDLTRDSSQQLEPHGASIYFSKDGKFIITVNANIVDANRPEMKEYTLYYYDRADTSTFVKPAKVENLKKDDFERLELTKPADK